MDFRPDPAGVDEESWVAPRSSSEIVDDKRRPLRTILERAGAACVRLGRQPSLRFGAGAGQP